jgi:LysM repeat protein
LPKKTLGVAALMTSLGIVGGVGATVATAGAADAAPLTQSAPIAASVAAALPKAATPAVAPTGYESYTVRSGDTLAKVAERFSTSVWTLAGVNHIADINLIYVGQVLRIPRAGYTPATTESSYQRSYQPVYTSYQAPYHSSYQQTSYGSYNPSGVWACIAQHESGGNPGENTGNGYYGMFQFSMSSWEAAGGQGNPAAAPAAEQLAVAQRLQSSSGWGNWPTTSVECGV